MTKVRAGPVGQRSTLGLRQRIQVLVGVLVVLVVVVGVAAHGTFRDRDRAEADLGERIEPARDALKALHGGMTDQETGLRGYLLTEDAFFLESYRRGVAHTETALARLEALLAADPALGEAHRRVAESARSWQRDAAERELALAEQGRVGDATALTRAGQERFDAFRRDVTELRGQLLAEQRGESQRASSARARLGLIVYAAVGASIMLAGATVWLLRRWVTKPLDTIAAAVDRVTSGELHHPVPALGPPELAALAVNVERMRARTVGLLDEALAAREALEQQGAAVVTLRAELQPAGEPPDTVTLAAAFHPAQGFLAGDWYDCVDLGLGRIGLALVDVSGHGPQSGVFALRAKQLLLAALSDGLAPGEALTWISDHIGETGEMFLTCLVVELDTGSGGMRWANAGHPAGVILVDGNVERLEATGPLLGPLPGTWMTRKTHLAEDALLVAFTDGLVEARNGAEQFGDGQLIDLLTRGDQVPEQLVSMCVDEMRAFTGGHTDDDVTLLVLQRRPRTTPEQDGPLAGQKGAR